MDSEAAILSPPSTQNSEYNLTSIKELPSSNSIDQELQIADQQRKKREQSGEKQIENKPKIEILDNVYAFFLRIEPHPSVDQLLANIQEVSEQNILITPGSEGAIACGFIADLNKLPLLQKYGKVSIGLPTTDKPSLLHIDRDRGTIIAGCLPIIAAARGMHNDFAEPSAWEIFTEPSSETKTGHKGVNIKQTPLTEINSTSDPKPLPAEIKTTIDRENVETNHFDKVYAVKIDVNDFGKAFEQSNKEGQIKWTQDLIVFFNHIEDSLTKRAETILGDRTTDSLVFYFTKHDQQSVIENAISEAIQKYNIPIKTVGMIIKSVDLTLNNNRVFHSSKPVNEKAWEEKEAASKKLQKRIFPSLQNTVAPIIYFESPYLEGHQGFTK